MRIWIVKQVLDTEPQPLKAFSSKEYALQYISSILEGNTWTKKSDVWFYGRWDENDLEIEETIVDE